LLQTENIDNMQIKQQIEHETMHIYGKEDKEGP